MAHILIGFGLCAALLIYPGGLCLGAAAGLSLLGAWGPRAGLRERVRAARQLGIQDPTQHLVALGLGAAVLAPLPWPGNPLYHLSVSGSNTVELGGVALSVGALWCLEGLWARGQRRRAELGLIAAWSLGAMLLALAVQSPEWAGVLAAVGPLAESGRLVLSVLAAGLLISGWPQLRGAGSTAAVGWGCRAALALWLGFPQLADAPAFLVLGGWWLGALLVSSLLAWFGAQASRVTTG